MSNIRWRTGLSCLVLGCATFGVLAAFFAARPALAAEVTLPELSNDARVHLQRVDTLLAGGQTVEALENLRRVISGGETAMMEVDSPHAASGFRCYLPVHFACQLKLAQLHKTAPEMLRLYRQQVDGSARRWLAEALVLGDEAPLQKIIDQYYCSGVGDDALFWLGEFAFQRGDYVSARRRWEQLDPSFRWAATGTRLDRYVGLPNWLLLREVDLRKDWSQVAGALTGSAAVERWLTYPDSDLDLNKVRARLVLTSIMQGQRQRALIELQVLRRIAPNAEGRLGGKRGNFVERLEQLLDERQSWPAGKTDSDWPTFGGSSRRTRHVAREPKLGPKPLWQMTLPVQSWVDPVDGANRLRIGEDAIGLLSFYPIVVGDRVLVGTNSHAIDLQAVDINTGAVVFRGTSEPASAANYDNRKARAVPRFTMTSCHDRVCFPVLRADVSRENVAREDSRRGTDQAQTRCSRLVCLDLAAEGRLAFDIQLEAPAWQGDWSFEGPPVCDEAHLYVALRRLDAVRAESHLACFDARNGDLCWRRYVCAAPSLGGQRNETSNNLLALDEGVLYYNSNAGAVAAVRAEDGVIHWLARYPRAANDSDVPTDYDPPYRFRDLNPCLVQDGLVYVAPADCSRLFALDAATGQLIWTTPAEIGGDIIHLLGVSDGHLIGSGEGLYWFDAYNGRLKARYSGGFHPSEGHARQAPRGHGRGLLADKNVYWPTRDSIFVFEQRIIKAETGWNPVLVREIDLVSRHAAGGNLVMANGVLLIASGDRLYAFNESGN